ncbi:MAG: caspase family protein, partial [bacterium]
GAVAPAAAATHVVAIGNDTGRAEEAELAYAERDAARFVEVMRQVGGVAASDVVLLTGGDVGAVRQALAAVEGRLGGEDVLVVYYSGHADAAGLHLGDETLPYEELKRQVSEAPAAVRVLILDGCRSGGLTRVKGAKAAEGFALSLEDRLDVQGLAVMTSSAAGEDSQESDALEGSFFSHHLMAAMLGAGDADRDGRVTLTEAYAYAYRQTLRASGRTATLQHPTYAYDIRGRGDLVLARLDAGRGLGRLRLAVPGTWLVRDGDEAGPVRLEVTTEEAGVAVVVPAGAYFVQARQRDHLREYQAVVAAAQVTDLAAEPFEQVAYARLVRKGAAPAAQGVVVLGGVEGAALVGQGLMPVAVVGYSLDLPWATLGLRGRFGQAASQPGEPESTLRTAALGLTFERVFDATPWLSLGLGLLGEGLYRDQRFAKTAATTPDRAAFGAALGGLAAVETPLFDGLALRLEGGATTHVLRVAVVDNGAQVGAETTTRTTAFGHLGVSVRF